MSVNLLFISKIKKFKFAFFAWLPFNLAFLILFGNYESWIFGFLLVVASLISFGMFGGWAYSSCPVCEKNFFDPSSPFSLFGNTWICKNCGVDLLNKAPQLPPPGESESGVQHK